jgi:hypothetical protein
VSRKVTVPAGRIEARSSGVKGRFLGTTYSPWVDPYIGQVADVARPRRREPPVIDTFDDIFARWVDAEARGDAAALDALLDRAFQGDGPQGYVLTKGEWIDRHARGEFAIRSLAWRESVVRAHGDTAVLLGVLAVAGACRGRDCTGDHRATVVAVRRPHGWAIVNVQLDMAPRNGGTGP